MAKSLEKRLSDAIKTSNLNTVEELIEQGVDCNLSYFDGNTRTFLTPIQLAIKNDRHNTLYLLYEHRNTTTKTQLGKHVTFYKTHHVLSQDEENETLFDYTVSCLLYDRITQHSNIVLHTLKVALPGYDNVKLRGKNLCGGSTLLILPQLRIYTLFQKIIEMTINNKDNMLDVIKDELLHNLETYHFLDSISRIPVVITKKMMSKKFTEIKLSEPLLIKYYQCIAKNVIKKIEELEINKEYTIPTGWIGHAICVSFRRISETHISIRIDNSTPCSHPDTHKIVHPKAGRKRIKPKVLGQLHVDDLEDNLEYFILLIDSVKRDLTPKEGILLIYNINGQICKLDKTQIENVPSFDIQADANCFVKCYEPGFSIRFGATHHELYEQLLELEEKNTVSLVKRCERESEEYRRRLYDRFILLAEEDISSLPVPEGNRLQYQLRESYKQDYQYLLGNENRESRSPLRKKYVPLQFKHNDTLIKLRNFFIKPRVLLLGEAGCGKTTICRYVTYRWACEKLWENKFEWVFYIKIRNLNSIRYPSRSDNYSLIDIIEKECFRRWPLNDSDKQELRNHFQNPSSILWILDGCDERTIPDYLQSIERELLDQSNLLLTSRPYVTDHLEYDIRIQIQGFNDEDIKKYIEKYFSIMFPETIKKCCLFIHDIGQLRETAQIPACLEIICSLWESRQEEIFEQGMTTGEIYEKMCEHLLRRYLLKFHGQSTSALARRNVYENPNAIAFTCLEYLAFEMTKSHKLMIRGDELGDVAGSLLLSVIQIGVLIPKRRNPSNVLVDNIYYFVHRSFQEYLCARYMIRALSSIYSEEQKEEVVQFIIDEKYNRNLQNTFRLFFELKRSISCTDQFWSAVDREPRDLVGLRHCSRIVRWFPNGICGFSPDDEEKINKRTIDAVQNWISKTDRRPHDYSNIYLFEWFEGAIDRQDWLTAWREDLLEEDLSKRRYFLRDLWSAQNIDALKSIYDNIPRNNVKALHRLITRGPTTINLESLRIDPNLFIVHDDTKAQRRGICRNLRKCFPTKCCSSNKVPSKIQKFPPTPWVPTKRFRTSAEVSKVVIDIQKKATKRELITTPEEFEVLLQNYASFASLNRQTEALNKETWRLKIDPSALKNIDKKTLQLLLQLSEQNLLFYRDFDLPVIPFLELYAQQNDLDDIICSLIVSITFSSKFILTAPPGERKLIRVHKEDETFVDIELDQQRWGTLINKFESARDEYGYSSFFST